MGKDLRDYLKMVRDAGPEFYVQTRRSVKPEYESCIIQEKLAKEGRFPVIYSPQVEGSKLPLVTNLFGSYDRWTMAFGIDEETQRKLGRAAILQEYRKRCNDPRPVRQVDASAAPVKEVVLKGPDVDLGLLPVTKHAALDSGKYVSIASTVCRDPDTGAINVGVYRHELKGKDRLGCAIVPSNHGAFIARRYAELGKPMEVATFIGHHPLVVMGSTMRGARAGGEFEVMGGLLGESLEVTPAETVDLPVPARAEIVIEGVIDPRNMVTDGPFGEWIGYYGKGENPCYLIEVKAITMRRDAIYHDLDPGHREHSICPMLAHESAAFDAARSAVPTVRAVHFPAIYGFKIAMISLHKRVPGEARLAGIAAVNSSPMIKVAVVVDDDIDIYNEQEVLWAVGTRTVADAGVHLMPYTLGAAMEPTAYDETRLKKGTMVTKMVIDATLPVDRPFAARITPPEQEWNSLHLADYLE